MNPGDWSLYILNLVKYGDIMLKCGCIKGERLVRISVVKKHISVLKDDDAALIKSDMELKPSRTLLNLQTTNVTC